MFEMELHRLKEVLCKLHSDIDMQNKKANVEAIQQLSLQIKEQFGVALPNDYQTFLKECDGIEFNGHILYGTNNFIENNLDWTDCSDEYLYLADYDIGWFVMRKSDNTFWELDKPSGDAIQEFETLSDMVKYILLHSLGEI